MIECVEWHKSWISAHENKTKEKHRCGGFEFIFHHQRSKKALSRTNEIFLNKRSFYFQNFSVLILPLREHTRPETLQIVECKRIGSISLRYFPTLSLSPYHTSRSNIILSLSMSFTDQQLVMFPYNGQ